MFKARNNGDNSNLIYLENEIKVEIATDIDNFVFFFDYFFAADGSEYVLFPACCYNGNCFDVLKKNYPPVFTADEAAVDMPVTITDVPRLNKDGSGRIEVTTGDVSTPCVAVFSAKEKRALFVYTVQQVDGINLGLSYEKGKVSLSYPHKREISAYRWPFMVKSSDQGLSFKKGKTFSVPYKIIDCPCESMEEFYRIYFENRKCMGLNDMRPEILPPGRQFEIQRDKFNSMNWYEKGGFYGTTTTSEEGDAWQPGWVGGGMSSYALMKLGGKLEEERALKTLEHLFSTQAPTGFFHESSDENGNISTGFLSDDNKDWHLIRKSADMLYFIIKHFGLMRERSMDIPQGWLSSAKKLADAFVNLWQRYGQLGQFVNLKTGELVVGGSTSAAIAPAGLVKASEFFNEPKYLEIAKKSARLYYERDAAKGFTTGGPEEILQCPDSESAFALLESLVVLYENSREDEWLEYAKHTAHLCSSWVVSYNYLFPQESEFARLGMKTTGSIFANSQNKHSAPGICTLSGDSLYKLYEWTKDEMYLELIKDIALSISQYMSTEARPVYSWDVPKDASLLQDDSIRAEPEKLPQGYICERVNMSDWESSRCIGGVFNGSCWSEVSNMLSLAELPHLFK